MHDDAADIKREADQYPTHLLDARLASPGRTGSSTRSFGARVQHKRPTSERLLRVVPATDRSAFDYAERMPKMHDEEVALLRSGRTWRMLCLRGTARARPTVA